MKKILYPLLVCVLFACSKKDTQSPPPSTEPVAVTEISAYLSGVDSLSEFAIAFKKATISAADASGGLTVFAPGNEAIGSYDISAKTMGKDLPDSVVKSHIVKGVFKAADLTDGKKITTLSGKILTVKVVDGKIFINGVAITVTDGKAGSQIVHTIAKCVVTRPGAINVSVYDATKWSENNRSGQLLAGATVNLYLTALEYTNNTPAYTAVSDANGIAHFTGIAPATYFAVVKNGDLSNIWPDPNGNTYVTSDTLFQSQTEIANAPVQQNAVPGDFRFSDLNFDGIINTNDKGVAPIRTITVNYGAITTERILIGYQVNHLMKPFTTVEDAQLSLTTAAKQISIMHKTLVMLDGMMSDDADCTDFSNWCAYDQFSFTATDSKITNIWASGYAAISMLNRIILSLPTLTGDTTSLAAQARGLRAYTYLELATYFGGLPIYSGMTMPANISRTSLRDTYEFIVNELGIAYATLPVTATVHLLTKGAARTLMARALVANSNYSQARTYGNEVINSGHYSLVDSAQIFANASGSEIVWDLTDGYPAEFSPYFYNRSFCPVSRISELYLIVAEGEIVIDWISQAAEKITLVRNRSGMPAMSMTNAEEARAALVDTYQREFRREGFRFANLVRWNMAMQVLGNKGYTSSRSLLPIPMNVIVNNPNMFQNEGY
jgi:uncharacterized surface protein with fasciclin (FAS1) repeats